MVIELEDACESSIFQRKGNKSTRDWSIRFSRGYNQIIDWIWKIEDFKNIYDFQIKFGNRFAEINGIIVIGHSKFLEEGEIERIRWRQQYVVTNSKKINIYKTKNQNQRDAK